MKHTFVIIVHYGDVSITAGCLASVYAHKPSPRVIVVDNSLNPKLKAVLRKFPNVLLDVPRENLGFAGANNLAMKKALNLGARWLILLNNDTLVPDGFFSGLIDFAGKLPYPGLVSPKIYFAPGFENPAVKYKKADRGKVIWYAGGQIDWLNVYASHRGVDLVDQGQFDSTLETQFATGCCLLVSRDIAGRIGFLDERYFLYFEDVDYSVRAVRLGLPVTYYPGVYLWHKNAGSSSGPGSDIHRYYQTRNRLYFGFKYSSWRTRLALARESFRQFRQGGILRQAVSDYYLGRLGKSRRI